MAAKKAKANKAKKKKKVSPIPKGYGTVTPTLNQVDAKATIAFCKKVFGAKSRGGQMLGPTKKIIHTEIEIGNSILMLSDSVQEPARVASLLLYVPDVDKVMSKAVKAGATVMMPAQDMFWGDRFARFSDPFGNLWAVATHIEDVSPADLKKRAKEAIKAMGA
jgi:uncharacterized glyoxalase superfamily protein PhnB